MRKASNPVAIRVMPELKSKQGDAHPGEGITQQTDGLGEIETGKGFFP